MRAFTRFTAPIPHFVIALILAAGVLLADPARAQNDTADPAIEAVIDDQIAAFQRSDLEAAFAHASPLIQRKFGTPETFGRMVRSGYPMIWRPSRYEHRGLAAAGSGRLVKTVLFEDASGIYEADYLMGETDGIWRIEGVSLRRLPGVTS